MEKRLVLFLTLSVLVLIGHVLIRNHFAPPPRQLAEHPEAKEPEEPEEAGEQGEEAAEPGKEPATGKKAAQEKPVKGPETKPAPSPDKVVPGPAPAEDAEAPERPEQWVTLGSFDPAANRRLLVTLCNRGAAVTRVELVERDDSGGLRYRELMCTHGYLGLHTRDRDQGCTVKVVGPGTPADKATPADQTLEPGFKSGDVILRARGVDIGSRADLKAFLSGTEPGDEVTFRVLRGGQSRELRAKLQRCPLQLIQPETPQPRDDAAALPATGLLTASDGSDTTRFIPSYLLGVHGIGDNVRSRVQAELGGITSLRRGIWKVARENDNQVVFSKRVPLPEAWGGGELEFRKRYRIAAAHNGQPDADEEVAPPAGTNVKSSFAGYTLQLDVEIHNHGSSVQEVSYVLDGANGLPLEGWWYTRKIHPSWGTAGARDVVWRVSGSDFSLRSAKQIAEQQQEALEKNDASGAIESILTGNPTTEERTLDYVGVDTQYFAAITQAGSLTDPHPFTCQQAYSMPVEKLPDSDDGSMKRLNTSFRMVSEPTSIQPGTSVTDNYHMFLGPKSLAVLEPFNLADIIEYGWFGKIARPLSWVLQFFYGIVRNYGLAIVLLTILVRGAMFPIGRKAARNAQVMQQLAPEVKKIKEKYKNDLQKQGQAQRDLWKKHNFNPLSGCWLMFLQLPIFIGLYRCLSVDINLRQAPLIPGISWCSNLSAPDMAWRWQEFMPSFLASETGWLGPYLNILPIFTIVLFLAQQKMFTPPATDDQTRMQQSMMKYMMIFIGVLFFKVPAGLCVYFIASSLWGIGERKLLPKPELKASPGDKSVSKKKSWLGRLREKAEADAAAAARQRRKRRR